jgi:UDP-N-acetylmuramoyl-L-alanyl-D-glutamate--2,6-diaminopimelate ligase
MSTTNFLLQYDKPSADKSSGSEPITSTLAGEFNVYNMLAAAAASLGLGLAADAVSAGIQAISAISGRMERIDQGQSFLVLVDFAHTPNALEKAIQAARVMTKGRIITVFGSAGKRDVEKRSLMAEISAREADLTVLTAEDPRTDSLKEILEMMAQSCQNAGGVEGSSYWRVADRGEAIYFALGLAQAQDTVLICGKGHEQSMCFGTIEYPWDDREATRIALDATFNDRPMPDLGLPTYQRL